jgi:hypothetical protein
MRGKFEAFLRAPWHQLCLFTTHQPNGLPPPAQLSWLFIVNENGKKGYPLAGIFCAKTIWFVDTAIGTPPNW